MSNEFKGFAPSGSGGLLGGGSNSNNKTPQTDSITGTSNGVMEILGVISEGEIVEIKDGVRGIYLNDTPIQNADGSMNFTGVGVDFRSGTQNQSRIPGFADNVNSETNVNQEVIYNLPVTRQIINKNVDAITVRLSFLLQEFPTDGGVLGSAVGFNIYIKEGNGAFVLRYTEIKTGRYPSQTEFEYKFPVNNMGGTVGNFLVKVERVTPTEPDLQAKQKVITFRSYVEAVETKLNYPNTALVGLRLEAKQFSSTPTFSFLVKGKKIKIPTNAEINPLNGSLQYYDRPWDGTFYTPNNYCCDPAWILWDLLTSTRYGLGKQIKEKHLDKYSFFAISRYCGELIPDGKGGIEPRFLMNTLIEGKQDAYKVIEALRSIFRGYSYFINGALSFVSDQPTPPTMQFTQADVEDGMFSYSRTGLKARHTVANVTWIDPDNKYKRAVETVEDAEGIAKFGVRTIDITAFACTSRSQARRTGLALLVTEKIEQETVTFKARSYAVNCTPGTVISIADSKRADVRYGGLIAGFDIATNKVTLDFPVRLNAGETYSISCMLSDGSVQERIVTNSPGDYTDINVNLPWSSPPIVEGNWIIASTSIKPQLFRTLNRTVVQGSEDSLYEIMALQYEPTKYNIIEYGWALPVNQTRQIVPTVTNKPNNISTGFQTIESGLTTTFVLTTTWKFPTNGTTKDEFIASYLTEYKNGINGDWQATTSTNNLFVEYTGLPRGRYTVRVAAVSLTGIASPWVESSQLKLGLINSLAKGNSSDATFFVASDM